MTKAIKKSRPRVIDKDNPSWTDADFKKAKRFHELPKSMQKALSAISRRGRPPKENPKKLLTLRLDAGLVDELKKKPAYNTRAEAALMQAWQDKRL